MDGSESEWRMNQDTKDDLKWRRLMSIMFMGASLRNEHGFFVMDTGSKQFGPTVTPEEAIDLAIAAVETAPRNIYHLPDAELGDARCRCVNCEGYRMRRTILEAGGE